MSGGGAFPLVLLLATCVSSARAQPARAAECLAELEAQFSSIVLPLSGAQVVARPGEDFDVAFDASENQLLACRGQGFAPWRFGHNLICAPSPACDDEVLVRGVAVPFYLSALGVELPQDALEDMILQRLAHWQDMHADFAVAGFESGGTTSLVSYLRRVPDIYMMPVELSDWGGGRMDPPDCDAHVADGTPPSYWPAFMTYVFWPEQLTVDRFNAQVARCASARAAGAGTPGERRRLVGVWDSRYAAHALAVRKLRALLGQRDGRVLLSFRDPVKGIISTFNRMPPDVPGGMSLWDVIIGTEVSPDPYQIQMWKGNYSVLAERVMLTMGEEKVWLQPFDECIANPATALGWILAFLGSRHRPGLGEELPHEHIGPRGPALRVDPCSPEWARELRALAAAFRPEYARLERLLLRGPRGAGAAADAGEVPRSIRRRMPDFGCQM